MVVESRSVIRNAKNARGLGRDRAIVTIGVVTCMLHQFVEGHFMSVTPL